MYLSFFPTPYPDEDFRSIIHRYHIRSINTEIHNSKQELLGVKSPHNTYFPYNIKHLLEKLPPMSGLNEELLINKHTLLPLFKPFISESRSQKVSKEILTGVTLDKSYIAGKLALKVISEVVRYCPICLESDYKQYGEVYAHRTHQLMLFETCPSHAVPLISHCPECSECLSKKVAESLLTTPCCSRGHKLNSQLYEHESNIFNQEINDDIQFIMNNSMNIEREMIIRKLREACWEKGYYTYSGQLSKRLSYEFLLKYSEEMCLKYGVSKSFIISNTRWRQMLDSNSNQTNIILYILLMRLFSPNVKDFLERSEICISNPLPYGCRPWKCLNRLCENHQSSSPILTKTFSEIKNGRHFVLFTCSACQIKFSVGWDLEERSNGYVKIINKGELWNREVLELYFQGLNNKEIAKKAHSNQAVIRNALVRLLGQDYKQKQSIENLKDVIGDIIDATNSIANSEELITKSRKKLMDILKVSPNLTRHQIYKALKGHYSILMKHDYEWLNDILPNKKAPSNKLDLELIDKELSEKVQAAAELLYLKNPSTQIKRFSIMNVLNRLDQGRIRDRLSKKELLPNTRLMLEKYVETKEDYLIRHIPSIVSQLKASGYRNPTFQSIVAFRRSYRNLPLNTQIKIQEKLNEVMAATDTL
ncbi:TnsD family Tn7-like transposition protein [Paenibacillus glycinis]|uniref:Transposon Tn7 transposition protein TnsD C-termianl domain-containing protein n=1 Tax=Paenibacillus glycinis TaxID=2697035 RepID=A0ABW9XT77_9BACL|nr:TnsD family Tn7-like transposition protein [Paenibacillus glycinis]NBD25544.1 hypothetical protein [Paenibacillus glycinis]